MISLQGKLALVTGASRGIGQACALRLADAGADVVVNYLTSQQAANDTAEEVRRRGRRAVVVKADVAEPEDVAQMLEFVARRFERLDVLVSNAATGGFRPLVDSTPQHFAAAMNANVRALITLVQQALPLLRKAEGRGKVVAMSSHGSHLALPHYGLIGASKAALESLVRHLALEIGPLGVNVNVVLAGLVDTDSTRHVPDAAAVFANARKKLMTGDRTLTAVDVADAVVFLSSSLSDLVQGQTLVVDGGEGIHG
ncbi:MAG: SDR family oxidoreductase [Planctomycetaceae bacterium]|nr:SDR family oxidoreductase [Planctomycetaceae bacterium]